MTRTLWQHLNLSPATLEALNELVPPAKGESSPRKPQTIAFFVPPSQPTSREITFRETRIETLHDWRAQDPVQRIANAILISAVRQRAQMVTVEPGEGKARVRFTLDGQERDHISLPSLAARPVVAHFKRMAALDNSPNTRQWGTIRLQIDARAFDLQLWSEPTAWGERLELRLLDL